MSLWTQSGNSAGAPKNKNIVAGAKPNSSTGSALFAANTPGSCQANCIWGVFAANTIEITANNPHIVHAGWQKIRHGTGPISSFTFSNSGLHYAPSDFVTMFGGTSNATANLVLANTGPINSLAVAVGGTGYNNTDTGKISGGTVNATFTLTTNTTGGLTAAILGAGVLAGNGFPNTSVLVIAIANSTGGATGGSGATFTVTVNTAPGYIIGFSNVAHGAGYANSSVLTPSLSNSTLGVANGTNGIISAIIGGRGGRIHAETLIAMSSCNNAVSGAAPLPSDV